VTITNDDGTTPLLVNFTFDDNLDSTIEYFNGSADFVNLGVSIADTIKNLTDVSEAVISGVATTIITHAALAGGTADVWADGDKGSAETQALSFACRQPTWAKRLVGTEETNKWPSFEDETINEVSFLKNRLVFLSDENVAMSEVDKFFNFFRSSTIDVLDSDRIDVALSGNKTSALHSAFTWNETLLTWSELGQFVVNGEPFLSPNTVRREATTAYVNTRKVKPVTSERAVYFLAEGNEYCQLWDYKPTSDDATSAEGNRLSVSVPRYMPGVPKGLLAISDPEVVLVLTDSAPEKLYVFSHLVSDQQRIMGGWHEWSFSGVTQILGIGSIDNEVSLILERDDGKVHLEVLDLWELSETTLDGQEETDDQATPPSYQPVTVELAKDLFTETVDDTFLSTHTADSGFGTWLYSGTETGPATYNGAFLGNEDNAVLLNTGAFETYYSTASITDGDCHFWADITKNSATAGIFPVMRFLTNNQQSGGTKWRKGAGISLNDKWTTLCQVKGVRFNGDLIAEDKLIAELTWNLTEKKRIGFRRVGDVFTYYRADADTGANEVSLGTFTLGELSTTGLSELSDGSHKGACLFTEGSASPLTNNWGIDNITLEGESPTVNETVITPDGLNPDDFPIIIGIDESGNEQTLTPNGDGTASWPTDDVSSQNVVVGIPVTSTIQLSRLFHRKNFGPYAGAAETRGNTYVNNLWVGLEDTTTMAIAIAITGHASFSQDLTEVRSLDGEFMHCRVGARNTEATITFSSADGTNFKLVGIDWEGTFYNRTRRMS